MNKIGGYVMVDFDNIAINVNTGSSVPVTVPAKTVEKLRQFDKPVLIKNTAITIDGGFVEFSGYTAHALMAGVHSHDVANLRISVTGDTQVTFTTI